MKTDYSAYQITVKTDPNYYGESTPEQAAAIARRTAEMLRDRFPGISVRMCPMIGRSHQDDTTGPDDDVCASIDRESDRLFAEAMANT